MTVDFIASLLHHLRTGPTYKLLLPVVSHADENNVYSRDVQETNMNMPIMLALLVLVYGGLVSLTGRSALRMERTAQVFYSSSVSPSISEVLVSIWFKAKPSR